MDGHLNLNPIAWSSTFRYKTYFSSSGYQLVYNKSSSVEDYYHRATLDYDGVFTQYAYPKSPASNQSWSIVKTIPENIYSAIFDDFGSGAYGYNSYYMMVNGRPNCKCPTGYSPME